MRHAKRIGIAALLAATPMMLGSQGTLNNLEERVLASHNRERASAGVEPMSWDPALAADARKWARHLIRVGYLVHYPDDHDDPDPQGENLWAGTTGYYGLESMVGLWIDEKKNFKPGTFPDNTVTGNLEDVGHYTQLMWRSSRSVGCAVARGRHDDFLVCRYSEGGNVIGETPF
jgi:uncharacterized protein YkwD